jgi:hypothetical protein
MQNANAEAAILQEALLDFSGNQSHFHQKLGLGVP